MKDIMNPILILIQLNFILNQKVNSPFRDRLNNLKTSVYKSLPNLLDKYYYSEKDLIPITVEGVHSTFVPIPFSYEYLGLCVENKNKNLKPNLGISELLKGSQLSFSNYMVYMNLNETFVQSCYKNFSKIDVKKYKWLIKRKYAQRFYLDKLPSGYISTKTNSEDNTTITTTNHFKGIPLGFMIGKEYYIYNHYKIYVYINQKENTKKYQVVEFSIKPYSINFNEILNITDIDGLNNSKINENIYAKLKNQNKLFKLQPLIQGNIQYSYDTIFIKSNQTFATRFDHHFSMDKSLHWYGFILANLILLLFTIIIICFLNKIINSDFYEYERIVKEGEIDSIQTYGWKDINGDVFRQPKRITLLSAFIGTGIEFIIILLFSLVFILFGFITPEKRGSYLNYIIYSFFGFGFISGYISTYVYKNFKGKEWLKNAIITSLLFPFVASIILIFIRLIFLIEKSTGTFSIGQFSQFFFLWIFIHTPLVLVGCILCIYRRTTKMPCQVNIIQRTINPKPWYLHLKYAFLFTGLFPFLAIAIEVKYLLSYMWVYQVYYVASFLAINIFFEVILSAEISIIFVFINLCKGDYNWWWKSFFASASPAFYIFGYSIYYYFTSLRIKRLSGVLIYLIIMASISGILGIISGACGSLLTYCFVYYLYSKIRTW